MHNNFLIQEQDHIEYFFYKFYHILNDIAAL